MPILKSCCFCCRLQTGAVILGYIEGFLSLIQLIIGFVLIAKSDTIANSLNKMFEDSAMAYVYPRYNGKTLRAQGIGIVVWSVISLIVSVALIIGATKRNHKLIPPYLFAKILFTFSVLYYYIDLMIKEGEVVMPIIQLLLCLALTVYLWLCIFSLFQELREQPNVPREAYLMQQQPYNPQVYKPSTIPN